METHSFYSAKTDLQNICDSYKDSITFENSLQKIILTFNDPQKRSLHFDSELLKIRLFVALFFFTTLTLTAWIGKVEINMSYIIYVFLVALGASIFSTMTRKTQIAFDFKKKHIENNNKTISFSDCKRILLERSDLGIACISYDIVIETTMGKKNMLLMKFPCTLDGESDAQRLADWAAKHIVA